MEKGKWKENAVIEKLQLLLRICLVISGAAAFAILVAGTVLRFSNVNWAGYGEVITLVIFWFYMLGAAYAGFSDGYMKNDICDNLIRNNMVQHTIKLIRRIVIAVMGLIMCWWGVKLCVSSAEQGMTTIAYGLPMIIGYISMIFGMGISSIFHVLHLMDFAKFYVKTYISREVEA